MNGFIKSFKRLLVTLEFIKHQPFVIIGEHIVNIQGNGLLVGYQCLHIKPQFIESIPPFIMSIFILWIMLDGLLIRG